MKTTAMAALLGVLTMVGCAADEGPDATNDDQPIPNGDGTFTLPASWGVDLSSAKPALSADKIEKSGSDVRTAVGPNIYSKNVTYTTVFPFAGAVAGALGNVSWNWSFNPYPPDPVTTYLCRNGTTDCVPATLNSGTTGAWYRKATSNVPFYLVFRVNGTGTMPPSYGQVDQLIINVL